MGNRDPEGADQSVTAIGVPERAGGSGSTLKRLDAIVVRLLGVHRRS